MKRTLILAAACLATSLAQAAPPIPLDQLQLRVTYRPCDAFHLTGNSMYNPRFFDGSVFAPQINIYCWASFPRGSSVPSAAVLEATRQTRMVSPIPGTSYLLASGGSLVPFTRYDLDGTHPVDAPSFPDGEKAESFDWVDSDTIICNDYGVNKQRLYLIDVTTTTGPDTLTLTKNTNWCADGWTNTPVSTRIRNVRVGQTDTNFAYYGDNGVIDNPKVYAIDLRSGESTELGHWDGSLKPWLGSHQPGGSWTSSLGLWTVVERGGYLYLQSSDDGIQVYSMSGPTTMGAMVASYSPEQLQAITGGGDVPYYGFDVAADDAGLILGDFVGNVFELNRRAPVMSGHWQLRATMAPHTDLGLDASSMYNPRFFDENVYAVQINFYCFGRYPCGSSVMSAGTTEEGRQTRMVSPFRGDYSSSYMLASSGASLTSFARWDWYPGGATDTSFPDSQAVESFDWVDNDTIICTDYTSKKRLYLVDVVTEPFALTRNITWNADGWTNTPVSTRIRNVRVGQTDTNYAYYGDNGVTDNPKVYAIDLRTGASIELGHWNGNLKPWLNQDPVPDTSSRTASLGLWTVVERGGYLYLQSSDDGVQVYHMSSPTNMDSTMYTSYSVAELKAASGDTDRATYGFDVASNGKELLLGSYTGNVYELEPALGLSISQSGMNVILSWRAYGYPGVVIQSSTALESGSFVDLSPQPAVAIVDDLSTATIPADATAPVYYRLRR